MTSTADFNTRQDGTDPPARVLAMMTTPGALRARAAIRLWIADQDSIIGDTHAEWRNRQVASAMLDVASKAGC